MGERCQSNPEEGAGRAKTSCGDYWNPSAKRKGASSVRGTSANWRRLSRSGDNSLTTRLSTQHLQGYDDTCFVRAADSFSAASAHGGRTTTFAGPSPSWSECWPKHPLGGGSGSSTSVIWALPFAPASSDGGTRLTSIEPYPAMSRRCAASGPQTVAGRCTLKILPTRYGAAIYVSAHWPTWNEQPSSINKPLQDSANDLPSGRVA